MSNVTDKYRVTWTYLAGFTDGDGSLTVKPRKNRTGIECSVSWVQRDKDVMILLEIMNFLEHHKIHFGWNRMRESYSSVVVQRHDDVLFLLKKLRPFLVLKQQKASDAIEFLESRKQYGNIKLRNGKTHTHCSRGHRWNKKNEYRRKDGSRHCRACVAENMINLRARRVGG